ncbi:hypothetical protein lerEdw1_001925, partial [Lerista edwardsae]
CSVSCGEGIQQRQVVCKSSDNSIGQCDGEKPETIQACKMAACLEKLPSATVNSDTSDHVTPKIQWVPRESAKNPVSKISSKEPCLGDKSIFCQMEVLARYCSIPGYNKLCCESCSKKVTTTSQPSIVEHGASETGTHGGAVLLTPFPQLPVHPTVMSHLQKTKGTAPKEAEAARSLQGTLAGSAALGTYQVNTASQPRGSPDNGSPKVGMSRLLPPRQRATTEWNPGDLRSSPAFRSFPAALSKPLAVSQRGSESALLSQGTTVRRKDNTEPRQSATNLRTCSPVVT